jgi:hypothetical protein
MSRGNTDHSNTSSYQYRPPFYRNSELHASKALAFVEVVSDSSRETDYVDETRIYARAGVPEYLIIDPQRGVWTLNTHPTEDGGYHNAVTKPIGTPVDLAGVRVELGR